jgi:hypothetical protein
MSNAKAIAAAEQNAQDMREALATHCENARRDLIAVYVHIAQLQLQLTGNVAKPRK